MKGQKKTLRRKKIKKKESDTSSGGVERVFERIRVRGITGDTGVSQERENSRAHRNKGSNDADGDAIEQIGPNLWKLKIRIPGALLIAVSLLLAGILSCAHFDFTARDMNMAARPSKIVIGNFDRRQVSFNPYLVQNFRDAVGYELFRLGYTVDQYRDTGADAKRGPAILGPERVREACRARGADLFIQGAVSEQETGEFTDIDVHTLVTFSVHDRDGAKIGEAYLSGSDRLADVEVMRAVSKRFVRALHGRIDSLPK